jgi:acetyltransferase
MKWGHAIFENLLNKRGDRELYPINKTEEEVLGIASYTSIKEVPYPIDLAVIVVPLQSTPQVMEECAEKGVKTAVMITAGFAEAGEEGAKLQEEIVNIARRAGLRFIGPNSNGFFDTTSQIFITASNPEVRKGGIGLISQSGNLGVAVVSYAEKMGLGFSKFVCTGNEADLHFEDFLEYLGQDEQTKVITAYVEGLREGRRFLSLARELSKRKPIVLLKSGRTAVSARAARSHTAALAGAEEVYDAAFKQAGVIRVEEIDELVDAAGALLRQPLPQGKRVGILSAGGGFAVIAAENCEKLNLEVPPLSPNSFNKLNAILPPRWSRINPVDTAGFIVADPFSTYSCLNTLIEDENIDAVLFASGFGMGGEATKRGVEGIESGETELLCQSIEIMDRLQKPLIIAQGFEEESCLNSAPFKRLQQERIVVYPTPERAAKALARLVEYSEYLRSSQS